MTWHYTAKDFFRQIPKALLARYFTDQGLFSDLDFSAMKKPNRMRCLLSGLILLTFFSIAVITL